MRFEIGFNEGIVEESKPNLTTGITGRSIAPVKSVVQVAFPGRGLTLAYYNDTFDLHRGDIVYVDGKLDGARGRAIVEGTKPYELEFTYKNREISNLVCSCFCSHTCKHEVAAMLQLRETMEMIEKNYAGSLSGCFAAISKAAFFSFVIDDKEAGSFTL